MIAGSGRSPGKGNGKALRYSWASLVAKLVKKAACNMGDLGSIPELGESICSVGDPSIDCWVRKIPWRRAWQPTPVFFPGESHRQRSLTDCNPWGCKEPDPTEELRSAPCFKDLYLTAGRPGFRTHFMGLLALSQVAIPDGLSSPRFTPQPLLLHHTWLQLPFCLSLLKDPI